jgi:hypothetical protein
MCLSAVREGRSPLVLTERTEHLELLAELLSREGVNVIALRGGMGRKALREALDRLNGSGVHPGRMRLLSICRHPERFTADQEARAAATALRF